MQRTYDNLLNDHISRYEQMIFLAGPRQVGKTTTAKSVAEHTQYKYLNWDIRDHRKIILGKHEDIVTTLPISHLKTKQPIIIFDEIHKYPEWKNFLKGFFDYYKDQLKIIVTGSAKLNIYKKGSDSLMGRYFLYREHPISVAECLSTKIRSSEIIMPQKISTELWENLWQFGGFPAPFLKQQKTFYNRWQNLKHEQLFREDIQDINKISEISQCEILAELLREQAGQLISYSSLANKVRVADTTIRKWVSTLESLYYCFLIRPWKNNIARSLIKEPKSYLWDWSRIKDYGAKVENFVAVHLHKAVNYWTDAGLGEYKLYYLRDKHKREVDFLVTKNATPWILIEVKASKNEHLSKSLPHFQQQIHAEHVFQVAFDMEYIDRDCFAIRQPAIVPAKTFLSQLV